VNVSWEGDELFVHAREPQRAVTPGQSLVLYEGEKCLGGAILDRVLDLGNTNN